MAYPYYPQYQPYYPQSYQPVQQTNQTPTGIIWVSGLQEAQMYPLAPNNAVALWEQSGKTVYLKQADATGKPTMRVYDLTERNSSVYSGGEAQEDKITSFALKSDLDTITAAIDGLKADLKAVKRKLKEKEVEDDDE